jgi:signal transduction histidine kinase/ActR/RegA family two-component response regulator
MSTGKYTFPFSRPWVARQQRRMRALQQSNTGWLTLPRAAQLYVAVVIAIGVWGFASSLPLTFPQPVLFGILLTASCLTSIWKVNLPIPLSSSSTLSVSYAADLAALLVLGPRPAVTIAVAGVLTQCTLNVRQPYPLYRTVFSTAAEAITMIATGAVYGALGGSQGPFDLSHLPKPLVGAIATYFVVNTGLVAAAIGLSTGRSPARVWYDDFLWSGVSFLVAGTAGAAAAIVIDRGGHWTAVLLLAPVYLSYRTYQVFVGRLEDQRRYLADTRKLHQETVDALERTRRAERDLETEKERLALALAEMTRLEQARNQLLEREQAARASAEQANRLKDEFLAIVSHELRTPLNAVLGWGDMLRRGNLDDERRTRAIGAIHENAQRQARLIDELLDLSRIISGKLRLERASVDWLEIARGALDVVQPAAQAKEIDIALDLDPSIGTFYGDGPRLQQIVWNLLSNAVKFTPIGGTVRFRLTRSHNIVELVVSDTGQGISRDFLPSVFEPFRQADGSTTRRHGGLGLGLSIVKHLVEAHGGAIKAESAGEGRGSTFTVRLPIVPVYVKEARAPGPGAYATTANPPPGSLDGIAVLVVDDDDSSREMVAACLEERRAEVLTASSAAEALDLVQRLHVDVMLADIAMPGDDGFALVRKLRAMRTPEVASIPAAALTAFARSEDRQQAIDAGFQLHLPKPIDLHSLVEAVTHLGRQGRLRND